MKKCAKCKQIKEISNFHRNSCSKDGYSIYCKECTKIITANRHQIHPYTIIKQRVLKKTNGKCYLCGSDVNIDVHHIIPRTMGGKDEDENLIPLCKDCHLKAHKGAFSSRKLDQTLLFKFKNKSPYWNKPRGTKEV